MLIYKMAYVPHLQCESFRNIKEKCESLVIFKLIIQSIGCLNTTIFTNSFWYISVFVVVSEIFVASPS